VKNKGKKNMELTPELNTRQKLLRNLPNWSNKKSKKKKSQNKKSKNQIQL